MNIKHFLLGLIYLSALIVGPAVAGDVRVAFYGDSTAWGVTMLPNSTYVRTKANEPAGLEWLLQARFGAHVFVENHGKPGSTCADFLWGANGVVRDWDAEMSTSPVDIVIVNFGLNDAGAMSMQDFQFCMQQLAGKAQSNGKLFVVNTPNPVTLHYNSTYWSIVHIDKALGVPVADHWNGIMNDVPGWETMLPDGIHPNDALYANKALRTFNVLAPYVESMLTPAGTAARAAAKR